MVAYYLPQAFPVDSGFVSFLILPLSHWVRGLPLAHLITLQWWNLDLRVRKSVALDVGNCSFSPQALQNIAAISLAINYPNKATRLWNVEC